MGNFPRIEIVFALVEKESEQYPVRSRDRYTDLERLKRLLDDGALTQEEYDSEKAKILND